ncbi:hypothetical protein CCACVL1_03443 [Corchorus capsularis]|uniref:Uncharacterized protein n=1 Tax=Corchorus capsularis TaxID=210143 RepID=A0A1R3JZH6_COCAP|nr:hypothetical protein CCACVL1_03443 [Corchorus capsularis]
MALDTLLANVLLLESNHLASINLPKPQPILLPLKLTIKILGL